MNNGLIPRGLTSLPRLFCSSVFDELEDKFFNDDMWTGKKNVGYPMNVVKVNDNNGNISAYRLEYALAGFDENDIAIELDGDNLHISAEKKNCVNDGEQSLVNGISYRKMDMSYRLMDGINKDDIAYDFKNGLLSINLPVIEPKKINGVRRIKRIGE